MTAMKRICVYCGSNPGSRPIFREAGMQLGRELARRGLGLVYGGASVGVMGAVAGLVVSLVGGLIVAGIMKDRLGIEIEPGITVEAKDLLLRLG